MTFFGRLPGTQRRPRKADPSEEVEQAQPRFDDLLDLALARCRSAQPPDDGDRHVNATLMAEVMAYVQDPEYLVTVGIRPDTAVVLPTRLRPGEGIAGQVLKSQQRIAGDVDRIPERLQPRMSGTRSVLALPILASGIRPRALVGVLNIESSESGTFTERSGESLRDILDQLSNELANPPIKQVLTGPGMVAFLTDEVQKELLFTLDPEQLGEIYDQILQVATRLTSAAHVAGAILLRQADAQQLGLVDDAPGGNDDQQDWVHAVAKLGDDLSLPREWNLSQEPSITATALQQGRPQYIADVNQEPNWKRVEQPYNKGSELNIPFGEDGQWFGSLVLLSTDCDAFTDADQRAVARLARYLGGITRRIARFLGAKRPEEATRAAYKVQIQNILHPLVTLNDFSQISEIRAEVLRQIGTWAKAQTDSKVGAVILAEATHGDADELVMHVMNKDPDVQVSQDVLEITPYRWPTSKGVTGKAYSTGKTQLERDLTRTAPPDDFIDAFVGMRSELAEPILRRNGTALGVIDVESDIPNHYTHAHLEWMRFLAAEASDALEAISQALRSWFERRYFEYEVAVSRMRAMQDRNDIQETRQKLFRQLIKETRELTGADTAQIYLAVNAYDDDGNLDLENGALGAVTASQRPDLPEPTTPMIHYLPVREGMAGTVIRNKKPTFFKEARGRPKEYLPNIIMARSALVVPILEGERAIGVINLESLEERRFGPLQLDIVQYAASMASSIQVGYVLSMGQKQLDALMQFDEDIDTPDVKSYIERILMTAHNLTRSPTRASWVQVALVSANRIEYACSQTFVGESASPVQEDIQAPVPIQNPVFQHVLNTSPPQPYLIPDIRRPGALWPVDSLPWKEAGSLLCVPIMVATRGHEADGEAAPAEASARPQAAVAGLLTVASADAYHLNDGDKMVLVLLAQKITHGLSDIAVLSAHVSLMQQLARDFKIFRELGNKLGHLRNKIQTIPYAEHQPEAVAETLRYAREIEDPLKVAEHLPQWLLALSNYYSLLPADDVPSPHAHLRVGEVVNYLRPVIDAFASRAMNSSVTWIFDPPDEQEVLNIMELKVSKAHERDLHAALYGCIRAAWQRRSAEGPTQEIIVRIRQDDEYVCFSVRYYGKPVSALAFAPSYQVQDAWVDGPKTLVIPEGQLAQLRAIARSLGGKLLPTNLDTQPHIFDLLIPRYR